MIKKSLFSLFFCFLCLSIFAETVIRIDNPDEWVAQDLSPYIGQTVVFETDLHVVNNYSMGKGTLTLSPRRIYVPTQQAAPGSTDYQTLVTANRNAYIQLTLLAGTYRMGQRIHRLRAKVNSTSQLQAIDTPESYGNPRSATHAPIGNYSLKVCSFNLAIYLASNYGTGYGPYNATEAARQHTKIVKALTAIDADIYVLAEIQQGQAALTKLTDALNVNAAHGVHYDFVNDGTNPYGSFTKVAYIYRSDRVEPSGDLHNNNIESYHRKKIQAFRQLSNGEKFVLSANHFKAKGGCSSASGTDKDQGDGQSCYNATRIIEAKSILSQLKYKATDLDDPDVLIVGDLNAYAQEDPITTFLDNGYIDLLHAYHADSAYSFSYYNSSVGTVEVGYLDHALANTSMRAQITGATVFHINADEHDSNEYTNANNDGTMFRSSDHDPVIIGLSLGNYASHEDVLLNDRIHINLAEYLAGQAPLTVQGAADTHLTLYNLTGQTVLDQTTTSTHHLIPTESLPQGIYLINISNTTAQKQLKIIIK